MSIETGARLMLPLDGADFWRCAASLGEVMIAGEDFWAEYARASLAALSIADKVTVALPGEAKPAGWEKASAS